jgi:hypothetical protein
MSLFCDQLHHQMLSKQKLHHMCTLLQMLHLLLQGALLASPSGHHGEEEDFFELYPCPASQAGEDLFY